MLLALSLFFTLFVLNNSSLYGQIKIQEKVEIKPNRNVIVKLSKENSVSATIEVVANWERKCGPEPVTATLELWREGTNYNLAKSSSTTSPVTVSAVVSVEGNYIAQIGFTNPQGHYNCADIVFQFFVDGKQQGESESCSSCGSSDR